MKTKIQEVLFDLIDILEKNDFKHVKIEGFQEFNTLEDFLKEQKEKIEAIDELLSEPKNEKTQSEKLVDDLNAYAKQALKELDAKKGLRKL